MISDPPDSPAELPASLYDRQTEEEDLWFLPPSEAVDAATPPWPRAAREEALLAAAWELGGGGELAAAASAVARLDEALRGRAGMLGHLALQAASDLAWATGTRVTVDRLALHGAMRAARTEDDAGEVAFAHWAYRRLVGPGPEVTAEGLWDFAGRQGVDESGDWATFARELPGDQAAARCHRPGLCAVAGVAAGPGSGGRGDRGAAFCGRGGAGRLAVAAVQRGKLDAAA